VHPPSALLILAAFIPWMLYNRRPATASGIFATIFFLGSVLFSLSWTVLWGLTYRWTLLPSPLVKLKEASLSLQQGIAAFDGTHFLNERFVHLTAWLSPFFLAWGLWLSMRSVKTMVSEHRSTSAHIGIGVAFTVVLVALLTPGKDILPGAWYLLLIWVVWSPFAAQDIAKKENFYSRGFRFTFLGAFVVCAVMLWALHLWTPQGSLLPSGSTLIGLTAACMAVGVLIYGLLKQFTLPMENRLQAFLAGSTAAYFLTLSCQFFQ
jgi:hypothetical protein